MRDLSAVREGWEAIEAEETRFLRELTVEESVRHFLTLQRAFEPQLRATDALFRKERFDYLKDLQRRLARWGEWRRTHVEDLIQSLSDLQHRLDNAGIPSVAIGGIVVSVWGNPRVTRDVDVKILLERSDAQRLLNALSHDYAPIHRNPLQALTQNGFLFVQDQRGTRIDLLLSDTAFDMMAIRRAKNLELEPNKWVNVCTAEDLIIYKLVTLRSRDREDAESVVKRQGAALDDAYVVDWLKQFEQALNDSALVEEYKRMRRARRKSVSRKQIRKRIRK